MFMRMGKKKQLRKKKKEITIAVTPVRPPAWIPDALSM